MCDEEQERVPQGIERARAQHADLPRVPRQRGEPDEDES